MINKTIYFIILAVCSPLNASIQNAILQPVAPDIFMISWQASGENCTYKLVNSDSNTVIFEQQAGGKGFAFTRVSGEKDKVVSYELFEIDAKGKVSASFQVKGIAGSNITCFGSFERFNPGDRKVDGFAFGQSDSWQIQVAHDGKGGKCLGFVPNGNSRVLEFSVQTPYYYIWPGTKYTFSWDIESLENNCERANGQAYAYTSAMQTSFYAKVPSLYVYPAARDGNCISAWGQPDLPKDLRYVQLRFSSIGSWQPKPIFIDNVEIIDEDIELLCNSDPCQIIADIDASLQGASNDFSADLKNIKQTIAMVLPVLQAYRGNDPDVFFAARTELCNGIREYNSIKMLTKISRLAK